MSIVLFGKTPAQRAIALIRGQFSAGQPGLWFEAGTFTGLYQDSVGTTPATAVAQPVGLMLDKRLGLVFGPELVTNGGFDTNLSGWTIAAGAPTWSAGTAVLAPADDLRQQLATTAGKKYRVTIAKSGGVNCFLNIGTVAAGNDLLNVYVANGLVFFTATTATSYLRFLGSIASITIDSISICEDAGNHASQATAGARPTIGAASGIQYLTFDGVDAGMATATVAAGAIGNSNMDCFIAVKRNSAAKGILADVDATHFFGAFDSAGGVATASTLVGASSTYLVDGAAVPGGTGTTQVQLNTALTVGPWHLLEVRNLDLSAWTAFQISLLTGYFVNGNIKDVILLPAQSDANRSVIRKYLGSKVGLSL
jgi:hypothetical protein